MTRKKAPANYQLVSVELSIDSWKLICASLTESATQLAGVKAEGATNMARNETRRQLCEIRDEIQNDTGLGPL